MAVPKITETGPCAKRGNLEIKLAETRGMGFSTRVYGRCGSATLPASVIKVFVRLS